MSGATKLQVVYDWRERRLAQRLLAPDETLTFGTGPRNFRHGLGGRLLFFLPFGVGWLYERLRWRMPALVAPEGQLDHLGRDPWPKKMALLRPARNGHRLRLLPSMTGRLHLGGQTVDIGGLFSIPAPKRFLRKPAVHRDVVLAPGDSAEIVVDAVNQLRLSLSFVEVPERLARPRVVEPLLFKAAFWSVNSILAALIVILFIGSRIPPFTPDLAISEARLAKISPQTLPDPAAARANEEAKKLAAEEAQRRKAEREAAESRRMKQAEGRLGRNDATHKETVIPKGREDVLREKVSKTGILAAIGRSRAAGSGLSSLLSENSGDVEQAVTGLQGAKLSVGKGAGGLGVAGTGLGGGGTGFGKIQGSGNLDTGAGRGHGRRGPNLGTGKEREVKVGMETGSPDAEGGLTKEQVMRVVRSHAAAVKYCYEKELQRSPHLSGRIDISWIIHSNGTVDRARVAKSAMNNDAVEGCIARTVRSWQFPKSDADTIVQSFPFLFKGGS
jgi:hypothetical protein